MHIFLRKEKQGEALELREGRRQTSLEWNTYVSDDAAVVRRFARSRAGACVESGREAGPAELGITQAGRGQLMAFSIYRVPPLP